MPSFAKTSAIFFRVTAIDERLDNDITKLSYQCIKFGKSNSKVGITAHAYLNGKKRIFPLSFHGKWQQMAAASMMMVISS